MADEAKVLPSEEQVVAHAASKLQDDPNLGAAKLTALLQSENNWSLSEKRLKAILISSGLRSSPSVVQSDTTASPSNGTAKKKKKKSSPSYIPRSHLDTTLATPDGVKPVYFDSVKGKGLVADRDFKEGDVIFTEDAFISAPPSHALKAVDDGELCTSCFAPITGSLVASCGQKDCHARFCSRLCQNRAQSVHHPLLCPGQNPSIKPFLRFLSIQKWLSLSLVSRCIARILLTSTNQGPPSLTAPTRKGDSPPRATLEETMAHFDAFATVSELERRARNPGWDIEQDGFVKGMQEGHKLLCEGMDPRKQHKGRFPVPSTFPSKVADHLFSWDSFLRMLGRANLNSEAQGGMYLVHSHLNHSCAPNVSIRHPPPPKGGVRQATKIAAVANQAIKQGDELFITYQHPDTPLLRRRMLLWREYMFGPCECSRCLSDLDSLTPEERNEMNTGAWKRDAKEEEAVMKRKEHADMIAQLDKDRREKLAAEGKTVPEKDLTGLEDELRTQLGF